MWSEHVAATESLALHYCVCQIPSCGCSGKQVGPPRFKAQAAGRAETCYIGSEHHASGSACLTLSAWQLQGKVRQPQLLQRSSGSRRQCSPTAAADATSPPKATAPRSPPCKSPSLDSARHNSGHLTSGGLPFSHDDSTSATAPAGARVNQQRPQPEANQQTAAMTAVDALASAQQPAADGRGVGDIAAVLAHVLNMVRALQLTGRCMTPVCKCAVPLASRLQSMQSLHRAPAWDECVVTLPQAAATLAVPIVGRTRSGSGSLLADAAAGLAHHLAQQQHHLRDRRHEVVVVTDLTQDER